MEQCSPIPCKDGAAEHEEAPPPVIGEAIADLGCVAAPVDGSCWRKQLDAIGTIDSRFFLPSHRKQEEQVQNVFQIVCEHLISLEKRLHNQLFQIERQLEKVSVEQRVMNEQHMRQWRAQQEVFQMQAKPPEISPTVRFAPASPAASSARTSFLKAPRPPTSIFESPIKSGASKSLRFSPSVAEVTRSSNAAWRSDMSDGSCERTPSSERDTPRVSQDDEQHAVGSARKSHRAPTFIGNMGPDTTNLEQEEYCVEDFYHTEGVCQRIAKHEHFHSVTLLVICANAIYIGVDVENNDAVDLNKADTVFQVCEHLFCTFFTIEWLLRFGAFRFKSDCLRDMWFKFDSMLVVLMWLETWVMTTILTGYQDQMPFPTSMIKLFRLARLARVVRLARSFPELVAMIKGVKVASRAVGSALLMMFLLMYVFAVVMFILLKDDSTTAAVDSILFMRFRTLTTSMWTLLMDGTFLDNIGMISRALLADNYYWTAGIFMVYVLASALTVMNMLIGVLCEVVTQVAAAEKEAAAVRMVRENLLVMLRDLDADGSGNISFAEIQEMLSDSVAMEVLQSLRVDIDYFMDLLDMYFDESEEVSIHLIMEIILSLRGDRTLTIKDLLTAERFSDYRLLKSMTALSHQVYRSSTEAVTTS